MKIIHGPNIMKAIKLGGLCSFSYLTVYVARNILSVVAPQMEETGLFSIAHIGAMSTVFMLAYAFGQLINGFMGDKIIARWMSCIGLAGAGLCNFLIPFTTRSVLVVVIYGINAFFLSMIYGPMSKIVSENVIPIYTSRCTLGFAIASALASPIVGFLAMFFRWYAMFYLAGIVLIAMSIICFLCFLRFEKRGEVRYHQYDTHNSLLSDIKNLMKHDLPKYMGVTMLDGIVRTAVLFWIPTYLRQYLGFGEAQALTVYTVITLCISAASYISNLGVYELLMKRNLNATLLLMFCISASSFLLMFFCKNPLLNVLFLILAMMSDYGASNMLWSVYCPSLRDTGMVSSATGFLDFLSYMAAAIANLLFANAVEVIGWGTLILVWAALMGIGVVISLPRKRTAKA